MVIFILHYTLLSSSHNNIQHHYIYYYLLLFACCIMMYYPPSFLEEGRIHRVAPRKQAWVWCPTDLASACRLFACIVTVTHCTRRKREFQTPNVSQKIVVNKLNLPKRLDNLHRSWETKKTHRALSSAYRCKQELAHLTRRKDVLP